MDALSLLDAGLNQCAVVIDRDGGLLLALLTAGLVGGTTHCAGMCGPFVLAQVSARLERVPLSAMSEFRRLTGAAVLPYHAGRASSYALIGALSASVAGHVGALPGLRWLSVALLALAALFFLGYALRSLTSWLPKLPVFGRPGQRLGQRSGGWWGGACVAARPAAVRQPDRLARLWVGGGAGIHPLRDALWLPSRWRRRAAAR